MPGRTSEAYSDTYHQTPGEDDVADSPGSCIGVYPALLALGLADHDHGIHDTNDVRNLQHSEDLAYLSDRKSVV